MGTLIFMGTFGKRVRTLKTAQHVAKFAAFRPLRFFFFFFF